MKTYRLQILLNQDMYTAKDSYEQDFSSMEKAEEFAKENGLIVGGESSGVWAIWDGVFYSGQEEIHDATEHDGSCIYGAEQFDCAYTHLEVISSEKDVDKLVEACVELINSIDDNGVDLWDRDLGDTHSSIMFYGGHVTCDVEDEEGGEGEDKVEFEGISDSYNKLKKLLKEMGVK